MREDQKERFRKMMEERGITDIRELFSPELIDAMNAYHLQQTVCRSSRRHGVGAGSLPLRGMHKGRVDCPHRGAKGNDAGVP